MRGISSPESGCAPTGSDWRPAGSARKIGIAAVTAALLARDFPPSEPPIDRNPSSRHRDEDHADDTNSVALSDT
jgi:hypothetical protein